MLVSCKQIMSTSQSSSLVQGSGTHASVVASHGAHLVPGAHAIAGQAAGTLSHA